MSHDGEEALRDRYDQVFDSLNRIDLQNGSHGLAEIGIEDLFGRQNDLWLGFYTEEGLRHGLDKYGFFEEFRKLGFEQVRMELQMDDPDEHMMRVWSVDPPLSRQPLLELVVRRGTIRPTEELADRIDTEFINVLQIEWLQLQNPLASFTAERLPLPGQDHPGLGIGLQVLLLLRQACRRLKLDALATVPAYFHNAFFYGDEFLYFDPASHGTYLAVVRDVLPQAFGSIAAASWAIVWQMVVEKIDDDEKAFDWMHDAQVAAVSDRLHAYFDTDAYNREVQEALTQRQFRVFRDALAETLESKGLKPFDSERVEAWLASER